MKFTERARHPDAGAAGQRGRERGEVRAMEKVLSIDLIVTNPEVRGGRPVVAGTGICVSDVAAAMLFHGETPDEIATGLGLSLAQVHAALAYYYAHKSEIDEEIRQQDQRLAAAKEQRLGSRHDPLLP